MVNINVVGLNLTSGRAQPLAPGDIPTDTQGSAIGGTVDPATAGGRLTVSSTNPTASSGIAGEPASTATLYYLPYYSTKIALYEAAVWKIYDIGTSGVSMSVAGLTIDQNYDIYLNDAGGTLTMTATAWASHGGGTSARGASPPVRQNGAYVETGALDRRYLGTIRTISDTGTKIVDSPLRRYVWNAQNKESRNMWVLEGASGWTYTTPTWALANSGSIDPTRNTVGYVQGWPENPVTATVSGKATNPSTAMVAVGIGRNSTSSPWDGGEKLSSPSVTTGATNKCSPWSQYFTYTASEMGFNQLMWLEYSEAVGTTTWYGSGMWGMVIG